MITPSASAGLVAGRIAGRLPPSGHPPQRRSRDTIRKGGIHVAALSLAGARWRASSVKYFLAPTLGAMVKNHGFTMGAFRSRRDSPATRRARA